MARQIRVYVTFAEGLSTDILTYFPKGESATDDQLVEWARLAFESEVSDNLRNYPDDSIRSVFVSAEVSR